MGLCRQTVLFTYRDSLSFLVSLSQEVKFLNLWVHLSLLGIPCLPGLLLLCFLLRTSFFLLIPFTRLQLHLYHDHITVRDRAWQSLLIYHLFSDVF